ncbi:MAG: hypothetical protein AAF988_05970 [Pseudomonadota bacterium]
MRFAFGLAVGALVSWQANNLWHDQGFFADSEPAPLETAQEEIPQVEEVNPLLAFSGTSGYLSRDGRRFCEAEAVSPTLILTATHCVLRKDSEDITFNYIYNGEWREVSIREKDGAPGSLWVKPREDFRDIVEVIDDYTSSAKDKFFLRLSTSLQQGFQYPEMTPLIQVTWSAIENTDFVFTEVFYNDFSDPDNPERHECNLYSSPYLNEIVYTDCPTKPGNSGVSFKSVKDENQIIAVHEGSGIERHADVEMYSFGESLRIAAAYTTHALETASSMNSMVEFCEELIIPCDAVGARQPGEPDRYDEEGRILISKRPVLRP